MALPYARRAAVLARALAHARFVLLARGPARFDSTRYPVDQLSTDLASLKIDRSPPSESSGGWLKWLLILGALAGLGAGGMWGYPMLEAELFKTEVRTGVVHRRLPDARRSRR